MTIVENKEDLETNCIKDYENLENSSTRITPGYQQQNQEDVEEDEPMM